MGYDEPARSLFRPKPFGDRSAAHGIEYIKATPSLLLVTGGGKPLSRPKSGMKIRLTCPQPTRPLRRPTLVGPWEAWVLTSVAGEEATSTFPENPPEQQSMLLRSTAGKNCGFVSFLCLIWTTDQLADFGFSTPQPSLVRGATTAHKSRESQPFPNAKEGESWALR